MTRQKNNESYSYYLGRWRSKAAQMKNRPSERDQVRMVVRGQLYKKSNSICLYYVKRMYTTLD
uniref:Uncharacterized protein n=1 Tax=Utricularia reniformis TaxID=192314 RepID=A0A1Y0B477_9LAMI|nr:hypothetical protein AEK19_MT2064 [Utricularia reniformis]ART32221.1 hypothetical protein AEK19_MT2064 [Utricularia reniformis]